MKISEQLAKNFQQATETPDRTACPDTRSLSALVAGELPGGQRDDILDHVVTCSDCAFELKLAKESTDFVARAVPERTSSFGKRWAIPMAIAAFLLLMISTRFLPEPAERPVMRSAQVAVTPASAAFISAPPKQLQWPPRRGAHSYRATLFDATGEEVYIGPWSPEASLPIPSDIQTSLAPGEFYWVVELRGTVKWKKLGPFMFHLKEPEP